VLRETNRPLPSRKIDPGELGVKAGKGFYARRDRECARDGFISGKSSGRSARHAAPSGVSFSPFLI
jgi:hypothetical protein